MSEKRKKSMWEKILIKCNDKLAMFTQNIVKYKIIYIFGTPLLVIIILKLIAYNNRAINTSEWFGQIMGLIGFGLSIVLLDSIPYKEKFVKQVKTKNKVRETTDLLANIFDDCNLMAKIVDYKSFKSKREVMINKNTNLIMYFGALKSNEDIELSSKLEEYLNIFYEYNSQDKVNWYENELAANHYFKLMRNILGEIYLIKTKYNNENFDRELEDM
ncbi:hypothetical protein ACFC9R_10105 [Enterococcus casseliflavus]